eukprot:768146-Hanusia_phi.AAC.2
MQDIMQGREDGWLFLCFLCPAHNASCLNRVDNRGNLDFVLRSLPAHLTGALQQEEIAELESSLGLNLKYPSPRTRSQ